MLSFLKQSRTFLNAKESVCIVIGNESCDLDSACSALCLACLAFLFQDQQIDTIKYTKAKQFLPVLNIPRRDYPLKTEVCYLFDKYKITENMLTFRDELQTEFLNNNDFILVDHHVSPFLDKCVAVFDHRPKDEAIVFPPNCEVTMELVGSCATLIGAKFLDTLSGKSCFEAFSTPINLLRSTIILDTVNFEINAARFTPKDQKICCCLEAKLLKGKQEIENRDEIFKTLCRVRADVSSLTAAQLLRKDLKLLKTTNNDVIVALPGFPLPVQRFIEKSDAEEAVKNFATENQCDFILLLGMFVNENGGVERDIGLINISNKNNNLLDFIEQKLLQSKDPLLHLEKFARCNFMNGHFFKQGNIKATRKHILPIVKQTVEEL